MDQQGEKRKKSACPGRNQSISQLINLKTKNLKCPTELFIRDPLANGPAGGEAEEERMVWQESSN